jgi:7,8-dihydro-6-hydroxymethylpterin-pyrophosphokinase
VANVLCGGALSRAGTAQTDQPSFLNAVVVASVPGDMQPIALLDTLKEVGRLRVGLARLRRGGGSKG